MISVYGGVAVSSFSWSCFDLSRKKLAANLSPVPVVAWLMLFQGAVFAVASAFDVWQIPPAAYWMPFVASVILNAVANVWFVESVSLAPFSLAIPILSLTPVFSAVGAWLLLNENFTLRQALGIVTVVAATFAIGFYGTRRLRSGHDHAPGESPVDAATVRKGLALMSVVALLFALTPVVDKLCLRALPASEHGALQCFATALSLAVWVKARSQPGLSLREIGQRGRWLISAVVFATLAVYFQFWSIQSISVGIFEALKRSLGLLAALAFGAFIFKESLSWSKIALVAIAGVGIFILLT